MISSEELAFVRLAMRKRLLKADQVKEAVERKKWDAPDRSLRSILVDMGALRNDDIVDIKDQLRQDARRGPKNTDRPHETQVGRDDHARESDDQHGVPSQIGHYKLLRLLGAGAMGAVYDAVNTELQREVALKLLMSEGAPNPRAIQRFKREARLAARLDHPNVVRIFEAGQEQGYHYIAMDKVVGHSVQELITLGEITPRRAVHLMRRVCEAVGYAHEKDVIHRDLKPANILVDEATGEARVTDFGLAVLSEGGEDDRLTRTGAAVGTPAYMAPEQVRGQLDQIDQRTDVYALGATFYEMLTSQPPFEAATFLELAKKICDADPTAPRRRAREVPLDVETICLKALEKRKEDRYQTAYDMAADLAAFLEDTEIVAQRPSLGQRFVKWARRRPGILAGLVGFLGVVFGAAVFYLSLPGAIEVSTIPSGATVIVDQESRGETPDSGVLRIELSAGEHEIRFEKKGYLSKAAGLDKVSVGHNVTTPVPVSLVSELGLMRLEHEAGQIKGVRLRVFKVGEPAPVREATLPFADAFGQGAYEVELSAPGYHSVRVGIEVAPAGLAEPWKDQDLARLLVADPTRHELVADPENVMVEWSRAGAKSPAPLTLRGSGRHVVTGIKPGYLPRQREVIVPKGSTDDHTRLSLAPLVAARRNLEGRALGNPLLRDVDGDGTVDVLVLVAGVRGVRLVCLPGMGAQQARYRAQTRSRRLIGTYDLDGDGDLDVILGSQERVEVREGLTGALLTSFPVNAFRVTLLDRDPPQLAYPPQRGGDLQVRSLSLAGGMSWKASARRGRSPVFLPRARRVLTARHDQLVVKALGGGGSKLSVPGFERTTDLYPVTVGDQDAVLGVPRRGPAYLVFLGGKRLALGDAESRFTSAASVTLPRGTWVFLRDVQGRMRVYRVQPGAATLETKIKRAGFPVVLSEGDVSRVWTTSGSSYLVSAEGWRRDALSSTECEALVAPTARPLVADLDSDGELEVAVVSRDRAAMLVIETSDRWLRWRSAASRSRSVTVGVGDGPPALALSEARRIRFLAGDDGRELRGRELSFPGEVVALAAGVPDGRGQGTLYVAYLNPDTKKGHLPALVQLFRSTPEGWKSWTQPYELSGIPQGLAAVSQPGKHGVLVGAPLLFLEETKDGPREHWRDKAHLPRGLVDPAPIATLGNPPMWIGARRMDGGVILVGFDATANTLVERTLTSQGSPARPERIVGKGRLLAVSTDRNELQVLRANDLRTAARIPLGKDSLSGFELTGDPLPRLILSIYVRDQEGVVHGRLQARDPEHATRVWERELPTGAHRPSPPVVVSLGDRQAVAVVAPSGVVLLFGLLDGVFLGERRAPEGVVEAVSLFKGREKGAPPALLLNTSEEKLLVTELHSLVPRKRTLRQRVQAFRVAIRARGRDLANALRELQVLISRSKDPLVRLALAEAHLASGEAAEAIKVLEKASQGVGSPAMQRVRIVASYLNGATYEAVHASLDKLKRIAPRQAADVALQLAQERRHEKEFIELATQLDPTYAAPRVATGEYLLRTVVSVEGPIPQPEPSDVGVVQWGQWNNRWWKSQTDIALRKASGRAAKARLSLQFALQLEELPRTRAAAIVAAALERAILLELLTRSKTGVGRRLAGHAKQAVDLLAAGGPPAGASPGRLTQARRLSSAEKLTIPDRAAIVTRLYGYERQWIVALAAIQAFTRE